MFAIRREREDREEIFVLEVGKVREKFRLGHAGSEVRQDIIHL